MELKNGGLEDDDPFQLGDLRFHVNFQGCVQGFFDTKNLLLDMDDLYCHFFGTSESSLIIWTLSSTDLQNLYYLEWSLSLSIYIYTHPRSLTQPLKKEPFWEENSLRIITCSGLYTLNLGGVIDGMRHPPTYLYITWDMTSPNISHHTKISQLWKPWISILFASPLGPLAERKLWAVRCV